ncbi:MarR family winged helix-turn-helix transcriptional regulator [Gayadomonas joobiniege]|uniref:MarR family winged helix-turn-helix transcriptional regulator n=1 Tax=Gayadomonas joobiniege TaxID=1234606 RepID=UPI000377FDEB|nr:MarR family winged helix-turn-helix transcriptional regulator [Gayadomonas joobiniege]
MSTKKQSQSADWLHETVFNLVHAYKTRIRQSINAQALGLNGMHVRVLNVLNADSDVCTANDIVHKLNRDKAQVARLIKDLIKLGFVDKCQNPADKRSQIVRLTQAGLSLIEQVSAAQDKVLDCMTKDIPDEDLHQFKNIMDKLVVNLQRDESNTDSISESL